MSGCDATERDVDAEGACEWMGAGGYGGDAVIDKSGGSSPDQDIAVLDADAAWSVGAAECAEEKRGW